MADEASSEKETPGARAGRDADSGVLASISRFEAMSFGKLTEGMNIVASIWIVLMVILVVGDVFGREAFNNPIIGTKELVQLSIPGIVYLQLANTLREGRHVSSDVLMGVVQRKWPRIAVFFYGIFNLLGVFMMGMIAVLIAPKTWQAYVEDFEKGTQGIFTVDEWPFMALVIFGSGVMAIQYLILAIRDFYAAASGRIQADLLHDVSDG